MSAHKIARVITFVTKPKLTIIHVRYTRVSSTLDKKSKAYNPTAPFPKTQLGCLRIGMKENPQYICNFYF
jgi:hypothetical protein